MEQKLLDKETEFLRKFKVEAPTITVREEMRIEDRAENTAEQNLEYVQFSASARLQAIQEEVEEIVSVINKQDAQELNDGIDEETPLLAKKKGKSR